MKHFLLLCNKPTHGTNAETIIDHINTIHTMQGWKVWSISMIGNIPNTIDLEKFDAIGIHYTLHISDPSFHYLSQSSIKKLKEFKGLKCIWLHDEYRRVNAVVDILKEIRVDLIFSLASGKTLNALYPKEKLPNVRIETVFAGYVSKELRFLNPPLVEREIDVSYRTRRPPFWLGSLGQEKVNIGLIFKSHPLTQNFNLDISVEEHDRVYGSKWIEVLKRSKAVLCVESGASVIDFDGSIEKNVEAACNTSKNTSFEEIRDQFFSEQDGKYIINCISPRVFEAAATNTVMICFIGEYSSVIKPWEHYIPLEKDFSNIKEVIEALKDNALLEKIVVKTRIDLIENQIYSLEYFAKFCGNILFEELKQRSIIAARRNTYSVYSFYLDLIRSPSYLFQLYLAQLLQTVFLNSAIRGFLFRLWFQLPLGIKKFLRPILRIIGK